MGYYYESMGNKYYIPDDAAAGVNQAAMAALNAQRVQNGNKPLSAAEYNVLSGDYAKRAAMQTGSTTIDPAKTSGYTFLNQMDNHNKEDYMRQRQNNAALTEYQYRRQLGIDTSTVRGTYTPVTYGSYGHSTSSAPVGSGDKKIATQAKVVTTSSGTRPATASKGTTTKQSVAANQVKTSATTTAAKTTVKTTVKPVANITNVSTYKTPTSTVKQNPVAISAVKTPATIVSLAAAEKSTRFTTPAKPTTSAKVVSLAQAQDTTRIGSNSHYGQVQLSNGQWINQVEQTGAGNPNSGVARVVSNSNYMPTAAQVAKTGVTTQAYKSKLASEAKASLAANEAARRSTSVLVDKSGYAINQISGRGVNELGQLVTISTPVMVAGKLSSYTRGAAQAAQDVKDYYQSAAKTLGLDSINKRTSELARAASTAPVFDARNVKTVFKSADIKASDEKASKELEAYKKSHPSAVAGALATGYYYTRDLSSLAQGLDKSNEIAASKLAFLPSGDKLRPTIESAINATPLLSGMNVMNRGLTLTGNKQAKQMVNNVNAIKKGTVDFTVEQYDEARTKPVSYAGEIGLIYAAGGAFGSAIQASKLGASVGLVKAGEKLASAGVPLAASAGKFAGRSLPLGADLGMGGLLTYQVGSQVAGANSVEAGTKAALTAGKELAVGGVGFKRGSELVSGSKVFAGVRESYTELQPYRVNDFSPKITKAKISEIVGMGSDTEPVDLVYGRSFNLGNKPIVTHIKGEGLKGFKLGAGAAPESILSGKTTQSFARAENPFFQATVKTRGGATESKYLNSAMNIAERVYSTRKPLYIPEKFEITSSAIPETQRPAITKAIKSYKGELKVAGSVPMKAQSDPFTTRATHDLELYGDSVDNVISHVSKSLQDAGFKKGRDFRRGIDEKGKKTNQVEFALRDKLTGETNWDAGIEVFDHNTLQSDIPRSIAKNKSPIAFGYSEKAPVLVGNNAEGWIKTQDLSEQVTRKVAGSTFFKDDILQPAHKNRVKDILDTTTTATAFAVKGKLDIGKDIISFVNSASKKFTPSDKDIALVESIKRKEYKPETAAEKKEADLAKMKVNFAEKVASDPVFKFIRENQRLPTIAEVPEIGKIAVSDKVLLYESKAAAATAKLAKTGNPIIDAAINKGQTRNGLIREPVNDIFTRKNKPVDDILTRKNSTKKQDVRDILSGSKENITGRKQDRSTSRISDVFGTKREFSTKREFGSPRQRTGQTKDISESIGYSRRSSKVSETRARSPSPVTSRRTRRNTNSPIPQIISGDGSKYNISSDGGGAGRRTFDRSTRPVITPSTQTGSPSWSNPIPPSQGSHFSPSPRFDWRDIISPSPSPTPSPHDKSKSPSPPSPIHEKSKSPSPPSPEPKKPSPSPPPSQSPKPWDSTYDDKHIPIIVPRTKKFWKTPPPPHRDEIKRKRSDSQKSWRLAGLLSGDKLVSQTKVAKFKESVQSSYSKKRGGDIQDMVRRSRPKPKLL